VAGWREGGMPGLVQGIAAGLVSASIPWLFRGMGAGTRSEGGWIWVMPTGRKTNGVASE